MEWASISEGFTNMATLLEKSYDVITGNAILVVVLVGGLIGIGFRVFRKAKKACK